MYTSVLQTPGTPDSIDTHPQAPRRPLQQPGDSTPFPCVPQKSISGELKEKFCMLGAPQLLNPQLGSRHEYNGKLLQSCPTVG